MSTPSLALVPSISHLSTCWGMGGVGSCPDQDPYLDCTFYLNLGSTPGPIPSMSHLSTLRGGGQVWILIQLQIHIWLPLCLKSHLCLTLVYAGESTPDPALDPYLGCTFWPEFRVHSFSGSSPIYVSPLVHCRG